MNGSGDGVDSIEFTVTRIKNRFSRQLNQTETRKSLVRLTCLFDDCSMN